jgi:hypothetical protein
MNQDSVFEVDDLVILEGELMGCTRKVTAVGAGGLLVVKPDPPERPRPAAISDTSVPLQELAKSHG